MHTRLLTERISHVACPYVKVGRFIRFKTKDVEKLVDERATNGRKTKRVDVRGLGV